MTHEEPNLLHEYNFESRLPGESALAFAYFEIYRDAGDARTLRDLSNCEVQGKKRSLAQIGRWSSRFHWQARVYAFEAENAQAAFQSLTEQRREEITAFIPNDMSIALELQNLCIIRLKKLAADGEEADCKDLRQLALAYRESRQWIMELTGIMEGQNHDEKENN